MTIKEETEEWNRLIAEFMGWKLIIPKYKGWKSIFNKYDRPVYWIKKGVRVYIPKHMEFHSSWDWLMQVVEKIESIHSKHHGYFGVHISSNSCSIQGTNLHLSLKDPKYGYVYTSDTEAIFSTKLQSTFYNVVAFIKWYNLVKDKI